MMAQSGRQQPRKGALEGIKADIYALLYDRTVAPKLVDLFVQMEEYIGQPRERIVRKFTLV